MVPLHSPRGWRAWQSPLFCCPRTNRPCWGPCLPGVRVWDLRALAGACGISCREGDGRKVSEEEKWCRVCGSPHVSQGCTVPAGCPPGRWGGTPLPEGPLLLQDFGAVCSPRPPCPCEHHVPPPRGCHGTCCLIRSTLSSRDPCLPREGPACHYGLLYKAAAQQKMIRFPAAFSVPGPAGRAELPRGRSWAEP